VALVQMGRDQKDAPARNATKLQRWTANETHLKTCI